MIYLREFTANTIRKSIIWADNKSIAERIGFWKNQDISSISSAFFNMFSEKNIVARSIYLDDIEIGWIAFKAIDIDNKTAEVHIMIGEEKYWNKGYGIKAFIKFLNFGFLEIGLRKIYIYAFLPDMISMLDRLVKVGIKREGLLKKAVKRYRDYLDIVIYGLLVEDFKGEL